MRNNITMRWENWISPLNSYFISLRNTLTLTRSAVFLRIIPQWEKINDLFGGLTLQTWQKVFVALWRCYKMHTSHSCCTLVADRIWWRASLCPVLNPSLNLLTALLTAFSTDWSSQKIRTPGWTSKKQRILQFSFITKPRLMRVPALLVYLRIKVSAAAIN